MKRSMKKMILISAHVMIQWCYFGTFTSAMHGDVLGEEEALHTMNDYQVWEKPLHSTDPRAIDHFPSYLEKNLEDRKKSEPFFTSSPDDLTGVDSVKLMNKMLQSEEESWPEYIQNIFKTNPSEKIQNFWGFITELSEVMSTPVLQKTFFEILKEEQRITEERDWKNYDLERVLPIILELYAKKIKKHVEFLDGEEVKPENVIDIFTEDQQVKLGEYGIQLEKKWTPEERAELYRHWASHMSLYEELEGSLKGVLETQALQVRLIKKLQKVSLGLLPHEISQPLEPFLRKRVQALTDELVNSVHLFDEESWLQFWSCQVRYSDGIWDRWSELPDADTKKSQEFWIKHMPFYLKMKSREDTWDWYYLMEEIIVKDSKGDQALDSVMAKFLINPPPSNHQKNLIVTFLEFVPENTKSQSLKKIAEEGLTTIQNSPTPWFVRAHRDHGAKLESDL
ncbi:hypothetical protein DFH28DRAFT_971378 [Melampsora americana]|nr:hypothetical protein DFH28DRAFT_971378 [Melampsora americana]